MAAHFLRYVFAFVIIELQQIFLWPCGLVRTLYAWIMIVLLLWSLLGDTHCIASKGGTHTQLTYRNILFIGYFQNRFDRSFSPSSGLSGSMKRMPYPTYPCSNTNCQRNWSPLSHSTSYEQSKQQTAETKKEKSRNAPQVKLVSTSSTPANLLIADLANPWRELDTTDSVHHRNQLKHQNIELKEKPSKLKLLSDSAYKLNDAGSQSTFYPERDLPGRTPWSYKRNRPADDSTKQKVKFEDFDKNEILPSVTGPNYKLHFAADREPRSNGAIQRNVPAKQFIGSTGRVSDSDGRE